MTADVESAATTSQQKTAKSSQDKVATKSAVQQGINLKSETANRLSQQVATAATEIGFLTEATEEKGVALKKPKKSGVSPFEK